MIVHRSINAVKKVGKTKQSSTHTSGLVLEPGNWEEYDPFLLLAEDWFQSGTFPFHPHRGIETFTYVIKGVLEHKDNQQGEGVLYPGDAQFMTAGRGVLHSEDPAIGETVHSLQLWLNLPSGYKMTEPRYQNLRGQDMPIYEEDGVRVKIFSGSSAGLVSETKNYVPFTMVEMTLEKGAYFTQEIPEDYNGFFYVLEGEGLFGKEKATAKQREVVWLKKVEVGMKSEVTIEAREKLKVLFYAGKPLNEPVVARGPFVMNTEEEIYQAYADYRDGKFGQE
ncbi:pirin family protein [Halalkalibacter urbisdiaboli]|uniref:pirin family protein n=1 Tax=Halalkalibacter urbisdiaboli TaxID=1960589 RepID=UPI000B4539AD|nr:pirin family protein [Halalkalibacter urbisdiaboli]